MNLRQEKATNPFLRAAPKGSDRHAERTGLEAFAEIRSRKDNFKG